MTARRSIMPFRAQRLISPDSTSRNPNSNTKPVANQVPNQKREKSDDIFMKKPATARRAKVPDQTSRIRPKFAQGLKSACT